ncbi:hypothetical protein RRG08_047506 [Elysia crispata]|uniref:C-type lectin domain-containing protein n=1 Tax=Elysia crispata TaxID=231223 RepID=A0AAE1CNE0_9GAST|nr:hypothetical protein RRG08_047506 [Elysia crispata]
MQFLPVARASLIIVFGLSSSAVLGYSCSSGWAYYDKSCYYVSLDEDFAGFDSAKDSCGHKDAYLAEVNSEQENDFLKDWLQNEITESDDVEGVWLGAWAKPWSSFTWDNSKDYLPFHDWAWPKPAGVQNGKAIMMDPATAYQWRSQYRSKVTKMLYLCEACALERKCFNNSCYRLHCKTADQSTRTTNCALDGENGSVAKLDSQEERDFVKTFLEGGNDEVKAVFVAASDDYRRALGLINGNPCMVLRPSKDGWYDETDEFCTKQGAYLCEFDRPKANKTDDIHG